MPTHVQKRRSFSLIERPASVMRMTVPGQDASSTTAKTPAQQQQKHQRDDGNSKITNTNVLKHFVMYHVDVGSSLRWLSASP